MQKVAIKWKGEELKYVDSGDLLVGDNLTLTQYKTSTDEQFTALKETCKEQARIITELRAEIQAVKLENIEVVKGLISR